MRILVVYYSYDGNADLIAQEIAKEVKADVERLLVEKERHYNGFMKYVWHGREAVMMDRPKLQSFRDDIMEYDLIFLGTPVWAGRWAPVFNTFFDMVDLTGKKVACFYCHAGAPGSIERRFRKQLVACSLMGFQSFLDPLWSKDKEEQLDRAKQWAREMVKMASEDKR